MKLIVINQNIYIYNGHEVFLSYVLNNISWEKKNMNKVGRKIIVDCDL